MKHANHNKRLDNSFIDHSLGRTTWEIKAQEENGAKESAVQAQMSELGPGCFGGFEFGDDRSEKTTCSGKTATTYQFDEQSKFSLRRATQ